MNFTKNLSIKGTEAQKKDRTKFYECCDLTKKVYLHTTLTSLLHISKAAAGLVLIFTS